MPRPAAWEPAGARVEVPKVSPFPLQPHSHTQPIEAAGLCRDYQPKHRSTTGAVRRTGTAGVHRQLPADNQRSNHRSATPCRQDRRRSDALPLQPALPEPPPPTPGRAKVTRTPSGRPAPPPAGSRGPPLTPHRPRAAPPPCPARGARWDMESRPGGLARSAGRRALQIPGCLARRAVSSETRRCGWGGGEGVQPCLLPWRPARGPGAVKTTLPVVPRAAGGMEGRVAERLRGALGPLGFEVHAFKVLASRAVTSPAVTSGGVTSLCPEVGGNAGRWRCPEPAVTPAAAEGSGAGPSAPGEWPALCFPRLGRVGSGRGEAARPPGSRLPPAQTGRAPVLRSRPTAGGTASPAAGGCLPLLRAPLRLAPPAQLRDEATRLRTAAGPETTPPPPPPLSRGAAGTPAAGAVNGAAVASGEWGAPLCSPGPGRGSSGAWQRS